MQTNSKAEVETLQKKISSTQSELRQEIRVHKQSHENVQVRRGSTNVGRAIIRGLCAEMLYFFRIFSKF